MKITFCRPLLPALLSAATLVFGAPVALAARTIPAITGAADAINPKDKTPMSQTVQRNGCLTTNPVKPE